MIMITMIKNINKDNIKNIKRYKKSKKVKKKVSMLMMILKNNYNNNKQNTYNRRNTYREKKKNNNTYLLHSNYGKSRSLRPKGAYVFKFYRFGMVYYCDLPVTNPVMSILQIMFVKTFLVTSLV